MKILMTTKPVTDLGLKAAFYVSRYPKEALEILKRSGIEYREWIPNYEVPQVFSKFWMTVHMHILKKKGLSR